MSNQLGELKIFIRKFFIFSIPLLIYFGFVFFVLFVSGELTPIDKVIGKQKNKNNLVLLGLAYSNPVYYYKLRSVLEKRPEILALGTSRIMQLRAAFFKEDAGFFNAGGGIEKIKHFRRFLNRIPKGKEPKVIIACLDQHFFNYNWDNLRDDDMGKRMSSKSNWIDACQSGSYLVYRDLFKKKFALADLFNSNGGLLIGLNAKINHDGFMNDGSYYYGRIIGHPENTDYKDGRLKVFFQTISEGTEHFKYGYKISSAALFELRRFLGDCSLRNIYVIGFLPPYAHIIYEKIKSMKKEYAYIFKLEDTLRPLFNEFGYGFYNFSDIHAIGSKDEEIIDGLHGSEKTYLRLFILMAQDNEVLKGYARDINYLKARLQDSKGKYVVFQNNEF